MKYIVSVYWQGSVDYEVEAASGKEAVEKALALAATETDNSLLAKFVDGLEIADAFIREVSA